jgi:hypothetical protein
VACVEDTSTTGAAPLTVTLSRRVPKADLDIDGRREAEGDADGWVDDRRETGERGVEGEVVRQSRVTGCHAQDETGGCGPRRSTTQPNVQIEPRIHPEEVTLECKEDDRTPQAERVNGRGAR